MGRPKNDGKGRLGGRQKGTPNKVTQSFRDWLQQLVDDNRQQIKDDLSCLEPKDRLQMIEKFMSYCLPKAVSLQENEQPEKDAVEDTIERLARIRTFMDSRKQA